MNLESVFSAFEMADLLGIPLSEPDLVHSMKRLIAWTLDEVTQFEIRKGKLRTSSISAYQDFASLILRLNGESKAPNCTVITFNYDVAVDVALHSAGLNPNYGLNDDSIGAVNLLKLHGSVNWHHCSDCKKIFPETFPQLDPLVETAPMKWSALKRYHLLPKVECCKKAVETDSIIVPPSWNKAEYRSGLVKVWQRAATELKGATNIVVCGYSLPETDSFFRYLYGLGTVGDELLERFWVFDPSEETHSRLCSLLGPGARARFKAHTVTFEAAVQHMSRFLK